ncbi:hypothetical protein CRE_03387 [Caenorhabditis remanei]|uniref:Uncharacterized protein n=1 Tax=Caenorhabditis remanei TaxID=31234 RepID=E3N660_CAERE|nr:hypothetical protein CRE_03387 [Caenorhabditis remanei]
MFTMERLEENMRNPNLQEQFVLDEIRFGKISTITEKFLKRNCTMFDTSTGGLLSQIEQLREMYPEKEFALLAATRAKVDALNSWKICLMPGAYKYWAVNRKPVSGNTEAFKFVEHAFPPPLFLAPGCRVIITHSMRRDHSVTNGTLGILKAASKAEMVVTVKGRNIHLHRIPYRNDKEMWWQFPLAPAEATTIHIVQGKTFDGVVLVTGTPLPHNGAVYTALS